MKAYIKDMVSGNVREYGSNCHDSLRISDDGTYLTYENLQCGDGSIAGDKEHSGFVFCDEEGHTPDEDETLIRHGADAYFNIGGWNVPVWHTEPPTEEGEYLVKVKGCYFHDIAHYSKNLYKVDEYDFPNEKRAGWYEYDSECGYYEVRVEHWTYIPAYEGSES